MRRDTFQEEATACVKAVSRKRIGYLKYSEKGSVPRVWGVRGQWLARWGQRVCTASIGPFGFHSESSESLSACFPLGVFCLFVCFFG